MPDILRFTQEAYKALEKMARANPDLYYDVNTDFLEELADRDLDPITEHTGLTAQNPIAFDIPDPFQRSVDEAALLYHQNLNLTARQATDANMWTWITHCHLHPYILQRWPVHRKDRQRHVMLHWFVPNKGSGLWNTNAAARLWWLAEIAHRAARASLGTLTPEEAVARFVADAEIYHQNMRYQCLRSPVVLAEMTRALLRVGIGLNARGYRHIARLLNRRAGSLVLEALGQDKVHDMITEKFHLVMKSPQYVRHRDYVREPRRFKILSLGAGVQSTVLALMADRGVHGLEKPDIAIFADTGWEPQSVYTHLDWLESELSYPVLRVNNGNIRDDTLSGIHSEGGKFIKMPLFFRNNADQIGMLSRQCTEHYKITPIHHAIKEHLGVSHARDIPKDLSIEMWMGISVDELVRSKPSRVQWIKNVFPLIDRGFTRTQLQDWFERHYPGRPLPRSACIGCPYHSNREWQDMREHDPQAWQDAVYVDWTLRYVHAAVRDTLGMDAYLHASTEPLADADLSTAVPSLMDVECEGMCGI